MKAPEFPDNDNFSFTVDATKKRRRLIFAALLLSVLALAAVYPSWKLIKYVRAKQMASAGMEAYLEKDFRTAHTKALNAYNISPHHPNVLRLMGYLTLANDPERSYHFLKLLLDTHEDITEDDRIHFARASLQSGHFTQAWEQVETLEMHGSDNMDLSLLKIDCYIRMGDFDTSIEYANKLLSTGILPPEFVEHYYKLASRHGDEWQRDKAYELLRNLSRKESKYKLTALRILTKFNLESASESVSTRKELTTHPNATLQDRLHALASEFKNHPHDKSNIVERAMALFDLNNDNELHQLSTWMRLQHLNDELIDLISDKRALSNRNLLLVKLDALVIKGNWEHAKELLETPSSPLETFFKHLFLSRYHVSKSSTSRSENEWEQALISAGSDPQKLWYAHDYASKLDWHPLVQMTLKRLTQITSEKRKAYEKLIHLEQIQGNTTELLSIYRKMSIEYPGDPAVANDYTYIRLLLNKDPSEAYQEAISLVRKNPKLLAHYITLALAELKQGNHLQAMNTIKTPSNIDWASTPPRFRAVVAAVLQANNETRDAEILLSDIISDDLLPEEAKLVQL